MTGLVLALLVLLGLSLGSFLNVVIPRLKAGEALTGRSRCPSCRQTLSAKDLIPLVSFSLLAGRCRYCRRPISWRYPLVELFTAGALVVLYLRFGPASEFVVGALLVLFLIPLFVLDLTDQLVPDHLSLPAAGVALIGSLVVGQGFGSLLAGGILGAGFFAVQYLISRGRWVGDGDIRLGLLTGFALGFRRTVVALVLAYTAGAVISLGLLAARRVSLKSRLPLGTLLVTALFVSLLAGEQIADWYLQGGLFEGLGLAHLVDWFLAQQYD